MDVSIAKGIKVNPSLNVGDEISFAGRDIEVSMIARMCSYFDCQVIRGAFTHIGIFSSSHLWIPRAIAQGDASCLKSPIQ